jgi:rod shape determining protein RodA
MTILLSPGARTAPSTKSDPVSWVRHLDWGILLATYGLLTVGALTIYSVSAPARDRLGLDPYYWVERQLTFVAIGSVGMLIVMAIDYRKLSHLALVVYLGALGMLVAVLVVGQEVGGARAWFDLGPIDLQPTEFAKVALILALAAELANERGDDLPFPRFVGALALMAIPLGLVLLQPDLGSGSVLIVITMGGLLVAKANPKHIALITALTIFSAVVVVSTGTLANYQTERLTSFIDADGAASDQVDYAQQAISLGDITGKGYMQGVLTNGSYVYEQRTDFIFSAVGEQFGFLGAGGLLALFLLLFLRIWRVAQLAPDTVGTLICVGVLSALVWHVFENVGMNMGIMPVTGIPLPFVSYGGSSTIAFLLMIGLVESVHLRKL